MIPSLNRTPEITSGKRSEPFNALHLFDAFITSLKTIARLRGGFYNSLSKLAKKIHSHFTKEDGQSGQQHAGRAENVIPLDHNEEMDEALTKF